MALFFSFCLPSRKAGGLQIPCCQGIAVADYSFTLDALALKPSSFCTVGVDFSLKKEFLNLTAKNDGICKIGQTNHYLNVCQLV